MTKIEQLKDWIRSSDNIVFFSGLFGVSTESGIPDFRGTNGLYLTGRYQVKHDIGLGQDGYDMGKDACDLGNGITVDPDNENLAYSKAPDFTLEEIFSLDVFLGILQRITRILETLIIWEGLSQAVLPTSGWQPWKQRKVACSSDAKHQAAGVSKHV